MTMRSISSLTAWRHTLLEEEEEEAESFTTQATERERERNGLGAPKEENNHWERTLVCTTFFLSASLRSLCHGVRGCPYTERRGQRRDGTSTPDRNVPQVAEGIQVETYRRGSAHLSRHVHRGGTYTVGLPCTCPALSCSYPCFACTEASSQSA